MKTRRKDRCMDIKGLARNLIPLSSVKATPESKSARAKTDADNDREGDGQAATGEEQKKRKLTQEELTEAIKYLHELPGVKSNNLTVKCETSDGVTVIFIQDRDGKTVRRIPELELAYLTSHREQKSGHLLNKAL